MWRLSGSNTATAAVTAAPALPTPAAAAATAFKAPQDPLGPGAVDEGYGDRLDAMASGSTYNVYHRLLAGWYSREERLVRHRYLLSESNACME